ncbi:hypothetical protein ACXN5S_17775 [Pseudoroseicyclus sp. H15]
MADLPAFARFWMIARQPRRQGDKTEPRQRYSSRADALAAATRLAEQNDAPFVLLEAIEVIRPGAATTTGELF